MSTSQYIALALRPEPETCSMTDASRAHSVLHSVGCRLRLVSTNFRLVLALGYQAHCLNFVLISPLVIRYVPNPSPSVFRTTKNNHNILQGVADPNLRLTQEAKDNFDSWILKNGLRWTGEGGPLAPGGVDIVFIGEVLLHFPSGLARNLQTPFLLRCIQMTRRCPVSFH